jgi:DNA-binding response OmpR family regulator
MTADEARVSDARILIIEDNDALRRALCTALSKAGYAVTEAGGGKSGLASYRQDPFDVVITDILMEDIEGLETIRELRRDYPQVKIIAMSGGQGQSNYLELAEQLGARRTLEKPFPLDQLVAAVGEVLAESASD